MADLVETAKAEYLKLRKQRDELERKVEEIEQRIEDLEEFFHAAKAISPELKFPVDAPLKRPERTLSTKDAVIAAAEKMLAGGKAMRTRAILAEVESQGIKVGGKSDVHRILHVSSILNKSGRFVADRSKGWTLRGEQLELPKSEGRGAGASRPSVAAISR